MPTIEEFMKQYGGDRQTQPAAQQAPEAQQAPVQAQRRTVEDFMRQYGSGDYEQQASAPATRAQPVQTAQPQAFRNTAMQNAYDEVQGQLGTYRNTGRRYNDYYLRQNALYEDAKREIEAKQDEYQQLQSELGKEHYWTDDGYREYTLQEVQDRDAKIREDMARLQAEREELEKQLPYLSYVSDFAKQNRYSDLPDRFDWDKNVQAGRQTLEQFQSDIKNNRVRYDPNSPALLPVSSESYYESRTPGSRWTEQEKNTYLYLLGQNPKDPSEAFQYAQSVNDEYALIAREEELEPIREAGRNADNLLTAHGQGINGLVGTVLSIPSGIKNQAGNYWEYLTTGHVSPREDPSMRDRVNAYNQGNQERLNEQYGTLGENWGFLSGKGLGDVNALANSLAESATLAGVAKGTMALGGSEKLAKGLTGAAFFGNAADQTTQEALRRGATSEQALKLGTLAGIAEVAGEEFSIDRLLHMENPVGLKQILWATAKQGGVEASEEGNTTLLNTYFDHLVMGDKSELNTKIQSYMADGMSKDEAEKKAWSEWTSGLATDMLGGLISGGMMGGLNIASTKMLNRVETNRANAKTQQQQDLVAMLDRCETDADYVTTLQEITNDRKMAQTFRDFYKTEPGEVLREMEAEAEQNAQNQSPVSESPSEAPESSVPQGDIPAPAEGTEAPVAQADEFNSKAEATEGAQAPGENVSAPQERIATPPAEARNDSGIEEPGETAQSGEFEELGERYGTIEPGETPARESAIPKQIDETRKTGEAARTIYEAEATPESRLQDIRNAVVDGKFSYVSVSNEALANEASKSIEDNGWDASLKDWTAAVRKGEANEKLAAMGATLLNNAGNSSMDGKAYIDLATDYNDLMHRLGRGLSAARILKTLTPEGRLYAIQKSVAKMNEELLSKAKKGAEKAGVELNPKLAEEFLKAETDEQRDKIISQIQQNIADQIPSTLMDKWVALRYLNMLGNFKTQGRNLIGNTVMMATSMVKNHLVRAGIEYLAQGVSKNYERNSAIAYNPKLFAEAWKDFKSVEKEALGEKKYSDYGKRFESEIQDKRRIFKSRTLNKYQKMTEFAMEMGDQIFSRTTYADAMASWMQAHKVKHLSDMSPEMLERARMYAIKEAQEATFRDTNGVSEFFSKAGRGNKNTPFGKFITTVGEGVMPFRKTPANVMMRGYEYSPFGVATTIYEAFNVKNGKFSAQDVINSLSKNLTGTGLVLAGYMLAAAGKLRTKDEDEDLEQFHKDQGLQDYSFIHDGKSYTIDWAAPACIPLFIGAALHQVTETDGLQPDDAMKVIGQITDPMLEMSMLSGVSDMLEASKDYNNTLGPLPNLLLNAILGYATQGLSNSLIRQGEQASEEVRRTSYTSKESLLPSSVQRKMSQYFAGIPGYDFQQGNYIDAWGRTQKQGDAKERIIQAFLNPGYLRDDSSTPYDKELERLYNAGYTNAIPSTPNRSTKVNDKQLSPEEYETYAQKAGKKKLELIGDFLDSEEYEQLDDESRAEIIENLYKYAEMSAKNLIAERRGDPISMNDSMKQYLKVRSVEKAGISPAEYFVGLESANADGEGSLKNTEVFDWLWDSDYTAKQQAAIWDANHTGDKSWSEYKATNPVAILADFGIKPEAAKNVADAIDPEWSSVKDFSQEELWNYYKAHPNQEAEIKALWDAKGTQTSWESYKAKHGK